MSAGAVEQLPRDNWVEDFPAQRAKGPAQGLVLLFGDLMLPPSPDWGTEEVQAKDPNGSLNKPCLGPSLPRGLYPNPGHSYLATKS